MVPMSSVCAQLASAASMKCAYGGYTDYAKFAHLVMA